MEIVPKGSFCFNLNENLNFTCRAEEVKKISITIEGFGSVTFRRNSDKFEKLGPFDLTLSKAESSHISETFSTFEVLGSIQNATNSFNVACVDSTSHKEMLSFTLS